MDKNTVFKYNYSAKEYGEIAAIRNKYLPKEESRLERLKKLDSSIQTAGITESLIAGVIGALIFGMGLCIGLEALSGGIVIALILGIVGTAVMITAYPIYRKCLKRAKEKYVPEILKLTDELGEKK